MVENKIKAEITDSFVVKNHFNEFTWLADEPKDLGGTDLGPTPGHLLLSSIASCKLITMQMYAKRKGWSIDKIEIELDYEREGDETIFYQDIRIHSDLDESSIERVRKIAEKCPIAKLVKGEVEFQEKYK